MRIAVVGTGISGMLAARLLCEEHELHVFEAADYVGGHTNTVSVELSGLSYELDTGFMVFNHRTYPNFVRMLRLLGVDEQDSDMSFSVRCVKTGLEYQGSSLGGLFAQRRNLFHPGFHRMLYDILRFNRSAMDLVQREDDEASLGEFLRRHHFSKRFMDYYLIPMGAAIWSANPADFEQFPARFIVGFFHNHGLLSVRGHPRWKTVRGGAKRYACALTAPFAERIRINCPVTRILREEDRVLLTSPRQADEPFDAVVCAAHADQTLAMLADASQSERDILGSFPYQVNEAILHTDAAVLPRRKAAWASWNYCIPSEAGRPVFLTYNLNRLQRHESSQPLCETLNDAESIDPGKVLRRIPCSHPVYTRTALSAQKRFGEINGKRRTYFCGAYWGYGFHEDGVRSALAVGECFGRRLET